GAMLGFRCELVFNPDLKIGWVILTNTTDFDFSRINTYISGLLQPVFNPKPVSDLTKFTGTYQLAGGKDSLQIWLKEGRLYSSYLAGVLPESPLEATGNDHFRGPGKGGYRINYEFIATIITDCSVTFNETDYELTRPDIEKTEAIFKELEFRRMSEQFDNLFRTDHNAPVANNPDEARLYKKPQPKTDEQFDLFATTSTDEVTGEVKASYYNTLENTEHNYQMVQGDLGIKLLLQNLLSQPSVSFDTETTSIDPLTAELVGLSFSWEKGKGFYVPVSENQEEARILVNKFLPFFEAENIEKVGQNLKYDIKVLTNYGITVKGKIFDTMIAHYLINPDMRHNMDI
ncbi:MAG: hypothetical protein EOO01_43685, partial [Chitinophagaceae bacterium]